MSKTYCAHCWREESDRHYHCGRCLRLSSYQGCVWDDPKCKQIEAERIARKSA